MLLTSRDTAPAVSREALCAAGLASERQAKHSGEVDVFKRIFEARIKDLWNLYEATGELKHPGEKGLLRELFLRRVLEAVLPPHFGVGSGVIVDRWNRQSAQTDLLIYDRRRLPPLLEQSGHGIFPIDSVLRALEVKSNLDRSGLEQIKRTAWLLNPANPEGLKIAAKGNLDSGYSYYPLCGLFAYSTSLANLKETVASCGGLNSETIMICVMNRGIYTKGGSTELQLADVTASTRLFVTLFLQELEASAASRKTYSLIEWMG